MTTETTLAPAAQAETKKPSALAVMASRVSVDPAKLLNTLKDTVFQKATESELLALVVVANEYSLNPFLKEIYAFPAKGGGIVPVVSIDGWISMINRQKELDGIEFGFADKDGAPMSCTCTIFIKGRSRPVVVTEFYDECFRSTDPWKQMPRRMLRHKALIQAARVAFGFAGIYDEEEGKDVIKYADAREVTARTEPINPFPKQNEEPADEIPVGDGSTPQQKLMQACADCDLKEGDFMKAAGLKGRMIASLTDKEANELLVTFTEIRADIEK